VTLKPFGGALLIAATAFLGSEAPQDVPPATALAQAEARWRERGPKTYQYQIAITCFCPPFLNDRVRVTNGVPDPVKGLDGFNSVEKLFERIRQAISRGQYRISVKYDEQLGYPRSADLDPRREVKDDELYFVVRSFRPNTAGLR
jgi:hypothetical protein